MNNQRKFILVFGVFAVMGLLIWLLSGGEEPIDVKKGPKPYVSSDWNKEYTDADKDPKGLYLFNQLLRAHIDTTKQMRYIMDAQEFDTVTMYQKHPATFVYIGNQFGLQDEEVDTLLNRVEEGSDVFLAYHGLTDNIIDELFYDYDLAYDYEEEVNIFMDGKKHKMVNLFQTDTIATNWYAFDPITELYDDSLWIGHSSFMELFNLIEIKLGKGSIYLCTTPEVFQNYQIKRKPGYEYTRSVQALLPKNQAVYFLELGRLSDDYGTEDVDELTEGEGKKDDSYLKVIFENRTLLKAFLFGILGILIYLLFRTKRMRPIVPYLEPKKNTTKAFTETITSIYFSKRNPYGLLSVQRRNFYAMVQKHFFVDLTRREDERPLLTLSEKSNVSLEEIKRLVNILETKEAFDVNDDTIVRVHKLKQEFYAHAGIIAEHVIEKEKRKETIVYRMLLLPSALILAGIIAILSGFYLLVDAHGIGIILWPIGGLILFLGIRQLSKPLVVINEEEFVYTPSFGRTKRYKMEDLIRIEADNSNVNVLFKGNHSLIINQREMGRYERAKFKRTIARIKKDELW